MLGNEDRDVMPTTPQAPQGGPTQKMARTRVGDAQQDEQEGSRTQGGGAASDLGRPEPPPGLDGRNMPKETEEVSLGVLLQAIQKGEEGNAQRHSELRRELGKMDREFKTVKETAAKALVTSSETQKELQTIKDRLEKVERGEFSSSSTASTPSAFSSSPRPREGFAKTNSPANSQLPRSALLGGQTGGEFIVGGFPAWSRKQQLLDWG